MAHNSVVLKAVLDFNLMNLRLKSMQSAKDIIFLFHIG